MILRNQIYNEGEFQRPKNISNVYGSTTAISYMYYTFSIKNSSALYPTPSIYSCIFSSKLFSDNA